MAIKTSVETVKLTAITDDNWEDSYIKVKPFTIREVQEYMQKVNSMQKKVTGNEDKMIDFTIKSIQDRFVEALIWDSELKQLVNVPWETIEKEVLTVSIATRLMEIIGGKGKA